MSQLTDKDAKLLLEKYPSLTKERLEQFRESFSLFDKDGNGTIDAGELQQALNRVGNQHFELEAVQDMIKTVDVNGDSRIDFYEFVALMSRSIKTEKEELKDAFDVFDVDHDGKITAEEIRLVLTNLGQDITTEEIKFIMDDVDIDGDGEVDFAEFAAMMAFGPKKA
eukprot:c219_g1_i1.p1 GENE.c219_g1_i1~~c219_g1_i1.p1  ORF type:complete len:167 (-),score=52.85 c219_g1_i1:91-591(-)